MAWLALQCSTYNISIYNANNLSCQIDCLGFTYHDTEGILGNNLVDGPPTDDISDPAGCCDLCSTTTGCEAWSFYDYEDLGCYLKNGYTAGGAAFFSDYGVHSGIVIDPDTGKLWQTHQ